MRRCPEPEHLYSVVTWLRAPLLNLSLCAFKAPQVCCVLGQLRCSRVCGDDKGPQETCACLKQQQDGVGCPQISLIALTTAFGPCTPKLCFTASTALPPQMAQGVASPTPHRSTLHLVGPAQGDKSSVAAVASFFLLPVRTWGAPLFQNLVHSLV